MSETTIESITKANEAHQRAMPLARLLDYGMDFADASSLLARTSAGDAWASVANELAHQRVQKVQDAEAHGFIVTAREECYRAIAAFVFAQMAYNFDGPEKWAIYQDLIAACQTLARVSDLAFERREVPFAGRHLVGWLLRPSATPALGTVILFGGQTGWGVAYLPIARALAQRQIATLLVEGPGQGETRMTQGVYLDVDTDKAYSAWVDLVLADKTLGSPGIWGNSYGGLWAARTASYDQRIVACCVNGSFATPGILPFRSAFEQSAAMLGTQDRARLEENFARMRFDPALNKINCPLLVIHGGQDPLVQLADQEPFMRAATGQSSMKIWPQGDHTIYNHGFERTVFAADWFFDHFKNNKE